MQQPPTVFTKKSYQSPQLRVYGDIRELTLTVNAMAGNVDMVPGPNKT